MEESTNDWNQLDITGEHVKMENREKIVHAASSCKGGGNT